MQEASESEIDEPRRFPERTQWWIVSVLLHALGIALAAVASFSLNIRDSDRPLVVMMTDVFLHEPQQHEIMNLPPTAVITPKEEPSDASLLISASDRQLVDSTLDVAEKTLSTTHEIQDNGSETEKGRFEIGGNTADAAVDETIGSTGVENVGAHGGWNTSQGAEYSAQIQGSNFSSINSSTKRWVCRFLLPFPKALL